MSDREKNLKALDDAVNGAIAKLRRDLKEVSTPAEVLIAKMEKQVKELTQAFIDKSNKETEELKAKVEAKLNDDTVFKTKIRDWRFGQGTDPVPPEDSKEYSLEVKFDKSTGQLFVDVDDGNYKGLCLFIEINEGKPCVHMGTDLGGDNLLHAFGLGDELIITPESNSNPDQAPKSRYTYNSHQGLRFRY